MNQSFGNPIPGSVIVTGAESISISNLFSLSISSPNPKYIDVTVLDRNEYPYARLPQLGFFQANGANAVQNNTYADDYGVGIIYTYQAQTGQYFNSAYGYLNQLSYVSSNTQYDNAFITIFGGDSLNTLSSNFISGTHTPISQDALILVNNAASYNVSVLGSIDIVTNSSIKSPALVATPGSIVNAANSFSGAVWNNEGCWTLASNIVAKAGSSLPTSTTLANSTGAAQANGEWIVVYNGGAYLNPTIAQAQQCLLPGDILTVAWSLTGPDRGGGHITTIVAGSGLNATVLDNIQNSGSNGNIVDANDVHVTVSSLNADLIYNQAIASSIVVYRLDTPTISVNSAINSIFSGGSIKLSPLFSATDAGGLGSLPISEYALYDVGTGGAVNNTFLVDGATVAAHTSGSAVIVSASSLPSIQLQTSWGITGSDTIYISAYNGSYWGDWSSLEVDGHLPIYLSANQSINVIAPNEYFVGDSSIDTLIFNGPTSNFSITTNLGIPGSFSILDKTGYMGTTFLSNISRASFSNGNIAFDIGATQDAGEAYMLYQAAFNRKPDMLGLGFWIHSLDVGVNINTVASDFITSGEFMSLYGLNPSNSSFVTSLYANVLHRSPDNLGYNYWMGLLSSNNSLTMKSFILEDFASSPENVANLASQIAQGISYQAFVG